MKEGGALDYLMGFAQTRTAGAHQMRPFCRHSFFIIMIIVVLVIVVFVSHLKPLPPQKQPFSLFENKTRQTDGQTDGRIDGRTDRRTDGHDFL